MKHYIIALCILIAPFSKAQTTNSVPTEKRKHRLGIVLGGNGYLWSQENLNNVFANSWPSIPTLKDAGILAEMGISYQLKKYRLIFSADALNNQSKNSSYSLEQKYNGGKLTLQYKAFVNKNISFSPQIGLGKMNGNINIKQNNINNTLSGVLYSKNAVELFNHQYYFDVAVNLGFNISENNENNDFQIVLGYKKGFLGSDWSTDPQGETLNNSTHDDLNLIYLGCKMNLQFYKKR